MIDAPPPQWLDDLKWAGITIGLATLILAVACGVVWLFGGHHG